MNHTNAKHQQIACFPNPSMNTSASYSGFLHLQLQTLILSMYIFCLGSCLLFQWLGGDVGKGGKPPEKEEERGTSLATFQRFHPISKKQTKSENGWRMNHQKKQRSFQVLFDLHNGLAETCVATVLLLQYIYMYTYICIYMYASFYNKTFLNFHARCLRCEHTMSSLCGGVLKISLKLEKRLIYII